jgi:hypothetical protein
MNLIFIIPVLVVLGALQDGFYDEKKKLISSIFKSLFIASIGALFLFDSNYWHFLYLLLCWWVLFDPVYNIVRKLGLFYVGNTKWTDKLIRKVFRTNAPHFSFITKLMAIGGIVALFYTGKL